MIFKIKNKKLGPVRYLGLRSPRLEGDEYYELIDEFMAAIKLRYKIGTDIYNKK